ncbi:hypothetical protein CEXT_171571 [Caerostris extrusa]|uniref:Uncharacterized protein n=1 Tax=Caerostris extrusa TaxID=172846 RepID=A0AAV4QWA7_CAEEX|nr:hypothetical protein CEXT_171571 [Caerostris extrusa]
MFSVNTGEPPTPPNSTATTSPRSDPNAGDVAFRPANQSQDSGYDPSSPFSLHEGPRDGANTFFSEDDVFDDCEDNVLLDIDAEEEDGKERCPNCDTALSCICGRSGSSATDCTNTYFTASSSNCDSSSSYSSLSIRPSSMPIFIPRSCQNTHSNSSNQRLPCSECSSAEINPSTSRQRMLTDFIFNNSHPGSLPAAVISWRNHMSPPLSFAARMARYFNRNQSRTPRMSAPIVSSSSTDPSSTGPNRNHRRRICSEGTSLGLTPEEGHPAARDAAGSCPNEALRKSF